MTGELTIQLSYPMLGIIITALSGAIGALWALLKRRGDLQLSWSQRAESLWEQMEDMQKEIQVLNQRLNLATEEVRQLRLAIRYAGSLEALQQDEQRIPTSASLS